MPLVSIPQHSNNTALSKVINSLILNQSRGISVLTLLHHALVLKSLSVFPCKSWALFSWPVTFLQTISSSLLPFSDMVVWWWFPYVLTFFFSFCVCMPSAITSATRPLSLVARRPLRATPVPHHPQLWPLAQLSQLWPPGYQSWSAHTEDSANPNKEEVPFAWRSGILPLGRCLFKPPNHDLLQNEVDSLVHLKFTSCPSVLAD